MLNRLAVFAFAALALASCDGYVRSFAASAAYGGSASFTEGKLISIATDVARERGYTQKAPTQSKSVRFTMLAIFSKRRSEHDSVILQVIRDFKGTDRFVIIDWPSISQSDESKAVEAAIKARLAATQASNKSLQPTAGRYDE